MTESAIEKAFVQFAESVGCQALKLRLDGQNGWPDRTVVTPRGIFFCGVQVRQGAIEAHAKSLDQRARVDGLCGDYSQAPWGGRRFFTEVA